MKIRMTTTTPGSRTGVRAEKFVKDTEYDDLPDKLAQTFIDMGVAVLVKSERSPAPEVKEEKNAGNAPEDKSVGKKAAKPASRRK